MIEQLAADGLAAFQAGIKPAGGNYITMVGGRPTYACGLGAAYLYNHRMMPPSCLFDNWGGAVSRWAISHYGITNEEKRAFSAGFDGYSWDDGTPAYAIGRLTRETSYGG